MVGLFILASCQQKSGTPAGIIPKDKMQSILEDIHYAQIEINIAHLVPDSAKKMDVTYYNRIFRLHHVTAQQFLNSFDYYIQHPDIMDDMYQNMVNELGKNVSTYRIKTPHK